MPRIMPNDSSRVAQQPHRPPRFRTRGRAPDAVERVLQLAEHRGRADQQHDDADRPSRSRPRRLARAAQQVLHRRARRPRSDQALRAARRSRREPLRRRRPGRRPRSRSAAAARSRTACSRRAPRPCSAHSRRAQEEAASLASRQTVERLHGSTRRARRRSRWPSGRHRVVVRLTGETVRLWESCACGELLECARTLRARGIGAQPLQRQSVRALVYCGSCLTALDRRGGLGVGVNLQRGLRPRHHGCRAPAGKSLVADRLRHVAVSSRRRAGFFVAFHREGSERDDGDVLPSRGRP